jgi:hypothetical protein
VPDLLGDSDLRQARVSQAGRALSRSQAARQQITRETPRLEDTIGEYLGGHNPFPDESRVDVLERDTMSWVPATIVERTAVDEWTVEYDDGEQAWRDHQELRPHSPQAG